VIPEILGHHFPEPLLPTDAPGARWGAAAGLMLATVMLGRTGSVIQLAPRVAVLIAMLIVEQRQDSSVAEIA
jgi:hypothetical protein